MRTASARWGRVLCMLLGLFSLLFAPPLHVHADGGAPNLAYVSGTPSGISVIDVGTGKNDET